MARLLGLLVIIVKVEEHPIAADSLLQALLMLIEIELSYLPSAQCAQHNFEAVHEII